MKLFDDYSIVKFTEEDLLLVTRGSSIEFVFNKQFNKWSMCNGWGRLRSKEIHVENYEDVSLSELIDVMNGNVPRSKIDFLRLFDLSELKVCDMIELLEADYPRLFMDFKMMRIVSHFLEKSALPVKSYESIRDLLDKSIEQELSFSQLITEIRNLSIEMLGKDIFKREIEIIDGRYGSSYLNILPVRVVDYSNTSDYDNVAEMKNLEISIEVDDIYDYLMPFIKVHFDGELMANKCCGDEYCFKNDNGVHESSISGFDSDGIHNFFSFDSMEEMLSDIKNTSEALKAGIETNYTKSIKIDKYRLDIFDDLFDSISEEGENICNNEKSDVDLLVDFYERFIYRMEYMMKIGKENGFDLISFMGI